MKGFFGGLLLGIVICGISLYLLAPGVKEESYKKGFENGNKAGVVTGTASGLAQAVAEAQAKLEQDSIAVERKHQEEKARAARAPRKVKPPTQNWHVVNGQIGDPVE